MPRCRLRTLILAVALSALVLGAESMRRRRQVYRERAAASAQWAAVNRAMIGSVAPPKEAAERSSEWLRSWAADSDERARRRAEYYDDLRRRCEEVVARPWISIRCEELSP